MYIYIKVDTNDVDYIGKLFEISQEDLDKIKPLIQAISEFQPYKIVSEKNFRTEWTYNHNYPIGEVFNPFFGEKSPEELYPKISEDIHELFMEYCPYNEYGFHTIEGHAYYGNVILTFEK